jgi:hypothetical protein
MIDEATLGYISFLVMSRSAGGNIYCFKQYMSLVLVVVQRKVRRKGRCFSTRGATRGIKAANLFFAVSEIRLKGQKIRTTS